MELHKVMEPMKVRQEAAEVLEEQAQTVLQELVVTVELDYLALLLVHL